MMKTAALSLAVAVAFAGTALAKPPPDANPALHGWFQSLRQPGTGLSCCGNSDCHILGSKQWRMDQGGYQVHIGDGWVGVPRSRVLAHQSNPSGGAVAGEDEPPVVLFLVTRPPA
jgi:hypothetical protein